VKARFHLFRETVANGHIEEQLGVGIGDKEIVDGRFLGRNASRTSEAGKNHKQKRDQDTWRAGARYLWRSYIHCLDLGATDLRVIRKHEYLLEISQVVHLKTVNRIAHDGTEILGRYLI